MNDKKIVLFYIGFAFVLISILAMMGCGPVKINEPTQWKNEPYKCFRERYCNYQNQNNPDKSYCSQWASECSKLVDYEYCRNPKNRIKIKVKTRMGIVEGDDFHAGCWDILK